MFRIMYKLRKLEVYTEDLLVDTVLHYLTNNEIIYVNLFIFHHHVHPCLRRVCTENMETVGLTVQQPGAHKAYTIHMAINNQ